MRKFTSPQSHTPDLIALLAELENLRKHMLAANTHRTYRYAWSQFTAWCAAAGRSHLPADASTLLLYLTGLYQRGRSANTAGVHAAAIIHMHKEASMEPAPVRQIKELLMCSRRAKPELPRQMIPLSVPELKQVSKALMRRDGIADSRNRALLLFGFASALRAASLCAIDLEDIQTTKEGLVVFVRQEKQDRERKGRWIGVPNGARPATCPVAAISQWLLLRGDKPGPLFTRCDYASLGKRLRLKPCGVARVVKECLTTAGLNPAGFAAHSLRSGFVTTAGENGASHLLIATQTGHKSPEMILRYFRRRDLFKTNACAYLGL
jgi:integrase